MPGSLKFKTYILCATNQMRGSQYKVKYQWLASKDM